MQFKYPEILYFLAFLIVPVLIHLFQLQKFKKTPFTNVAFLQKLVLQTRKSSRVKKWLILAFRLLLFTAIIFAFSQPFFSNKNAIKRQHNFIYLDNSLSLKTKGKKGDLLQNSIKEIIENSSEKESYSLLTNTNFYKNISLIQLKNILLKVQNEASQRNLEDILLKIGNIKTNKIKTLIKSYLISDFQYFKKINKNSFTNVKSLVSFIKLQSEQKSNLSIDSVFIDNLSSNNFSINVTIKNQGIEKNNISIALYNNDSIFSKQTFSIAKNRKKTILFPIQNKKKFNGKILLNFNDAFSFDNTYFFTLNSVKKTNIFSIGKSHKFIAKIYTKNEFNFSSSSLQNINYNLLQKQELIILNELDEIPTTLATILKKHLNQNKSLVIIPSTSININSYNQFLKQLDSGIINRFQKDSLKITNINFNNPFFKNVFSKSVKNFQYPVVKNSYITNFKNTSTIIDFENKQDFISKLTTKKGTVYWISSAINTKNSNFTNSPLVVPVFYNFGKLSTQYPKPYYIIGKPNTIDIATRLKKNEIVSVNNANSSFIPLQQSHSTKVTIQTETLPNKTGIYTIKNKRNELTSIAYNYNSKESELQFLNIKELIKENKNLNYTTSIADALQQNQEKNKVTWLWKWFLALAIVSLLFEILILKFFKP